MKKLVLTAAIVLSMGIGAFAQQGDGLLLRSRSRTQDPTTPLFPQDWGEVEDQDSSPLGSGMVVLMGLGAAYLVGKRRKED